MLLRCRPWLLPLLAGAALSSLHCLAADDAGCAASLTAVCPTRAAPWKLFAASHRPLADIALVLQVPARPPSAAPDTDPPPGDALRVPAERMASVLRANGLAVRYAGQVRQRADAAQLPGVAGASHTLILVPTGSTRSDGGADYVALLYDVDQPAQPIFQSSARLGATLAERLQDIAATELVNAIAEAGLLQGPRHIAPVRLFGA